MALLSLYYIVLGASIFFRSAVFLTTRGRPLAAAAPLDGLLFTTGLRWAESLRLPGRGPLPIRAKSLSSCGLKYLLLASFEPPGGASAGFILLRGKI